MRLNKKYYMKIFLSIHLKFTRGKIFGKTICYFAIVWLLIDIGWLGMKNIKSYEPKKKKKIKWNQSKDVFSMYRSDGRARHNLFDHNEWIIWCAHLHTVHSRLHMHVWIRAQRFPKWWIKIYWWCATLLNKMINTCDNSIIILISKLPFLPPSHLIFLLRLRLLIFLRFFFTGLSSPGKFIDYQFSLLMKQ